QPTARLAAAPDRRGTLPRVRRRARLRPLDDLHAVPGRATREGARSLGRASVGAGPSRPASRGDAPRRPAARDVALLRRGGRARRRPAERAQARVAPRPAPRRAEARVPKVGIEPTRPSKGAADFESAASAVPPLRRVYAERTVIRHSRESDELAEARG